VGNNAAVIAWSWYRMMGSRGKNFRLPASPCPDDAQVAACGGCPAVTHGFGLDALRDRDPYCFYEQE